MKIQGWGWAMWLAGAVAAAGLLTASASGASVSYGVSVSKGCESPTQVGQDFFCHYVFGNDNPNATSHDTVIVVQAFDSANRNPNPVAGPGVNILPQLKLVFGQDAGALGPATCTGGTGLGTDASPYVGASSCTLPYGSTISSQDFDLGTVTAADAQAGDHRIHDQITFIWNDTCTNDPEGTCNPTGNQGQAPSATRVVAISGLSTDVNPPDGRVPLPVNDIAHLTGVTADAGGTIHFELFDITAIGGTTCTNTPMATFDVAVNHGPGDYPSPSVTINKVASYGWIATYSGDLNNTPAGPTACGDTREHAILDKSQTGIDTTASAASPAAGVPATVNDTARITLSSGAGSIPVTGTVTFHLYSDSGCVHEVTGSPVTASVNGTISVGGPLFVPSPQIQLTQIGTYFWRAGYSGDANNSAAPIVNNQPGLTDCGAANESVTVGKGTSKVTTTASSATGLPANLTDTAHLTTTPVNPTAGGTITFNLYSNNTCTALVGTKSVSVSGPGDYTSPSIQVTTSGTYFWTASYSGDANTAGFGPTACGESGEVSQVGQNGQIEICKAPDNGAAGSTFTFTLTNLTSGLTQTVQVVGGTCSQAINVLTGRWQVTEDVSSGVWTVSGIQVVPVQYLISSGGASAKVRVVKADETQLIFTNSPAPAVLKVCKYSSNPALQGRQYNFVVNGTQNLQATAGTSLATAGCSAPLSVENGANLKVAESTPANEQVTNITVSTSHTKLTGTANGVASITIGPGVNVVNFENEPTGPAQNGYIEICKDAGDAFISTTDPFTFTVTDKNQNALPVNVLAGQCSQALTVPAGLVTVAETPSSGTQLTSVTAQPSSALGTVNLINETAVVNVPVAPSSAGEVQVHFVNSTPTTQLKVCKLLGPNSGALAGQTFTFSVTDSAFPQGTSYTVTVIADANGACKIVTSGTPPTNVPFPIGSTATVTETGAPFVNGDGSGVGATDVQKVKIASGVNEIDFTNQAFGQFELCKDVTDPTYNGNTFTFSYAGADASNKNVKGTLSVAAGACSPPQVVPVGNYTITETLPTGFSLSGVTATGPSKSDNRLVSSSGNAATISVPFSGTPFPNGGETDVHFLNSPQAASVKVCKLVEDGAQAQFSNTQFTITLRNLTAGTQVGQQNVVPPYPSPDGTFPPGPKSCVVFNGLAIVGTNGKPIKYQVQESAGVAFSVSSVSSQNTNPSTNQPADPTKFNFTLNPGENVIFFDNTTATIAG